MKTKVYKMLAPSRVLATICVVFLYTARLSNCAPTTEFSKNNNINATSVDIAGADPMTTISTTTVTSIDARPWLPHKQTHSKHITKSNLYKKPTKDKSGWPKQHQQQQPGVFEGRQKSFHSPTLVPKNYDVEKDNLSRHKQVSSTMTTTMGAVIEIAVDNVNGAKDYTNKHSTNSPNLRHAIIKTESISTNVDDDHDVAGKDIDFISVSGTTKADKTFATVSSSTEGYHAKTETAAAVEATMQTGLVENPNLNAKPNAKTSTKSSLADDVQEIKSISSIPSVKPILANGKSFPVNASSSSSSSSLSLSFSQPHRVGATVVPKQLDVGHDGVKITKKKQLFDKHFIAATTGLLPDPSGSLHPQITKDNPWPLPKNKPTKMVKKLMEVPNGYLGPIMMKEKTFSGSYHAKKPKPSIVEQLRDKKLVEIIAPTALMEPTSKLKGATAVPPPEFVEIDSVTSTTTTSTSAPPLVPTSATTTEEETESETATTYFLVVSQENKSTEMGKTPTIGSEMEPASSAEIETTLREIYTEVLKAIDGEAKRKSTSTEHSPTNAPEFENDHSRSSTGRFIETETDPSFSTDSDHVQNITKTQETQTVVPQKVDINFSPDHSRLSGRVFIEAEPDHAHSPEFNRDQSSSTTPKKQKLFPNKLDNFGDSGRLRSPSESNTKAEDDRPRSLNTEASQEIDTKSDHDYLRTSSGGTRKPQTFEHLSDQYRNGERVLTTIGDCLPHTTPDELTTPRSDTDRLSVSTTSIAERKISPDQVFNAKSSEEDLKSTLSTARGAQPSSLQTIPDTIPPTIADLSTIVPPFANDDNSGSSRDYQKNIDLSNTLNPIAKTSNALPTVHVSRGITDQTSTPSPMTHHDSSTGTSSTPLPITDTDTSANNFRTILDDSVTFSAVTINPTTQTSAQTLKPALESEQRESKISDIQIEVYDSTIEPILASTNFKDSNENNFSSSSSNNFSQDKFTQYVVDKVTDRATQDSNSIAKASGKPEPAAIEIHINVSEGFGNESEDLEFSYRQSDYRKGTLKKPSNSNFITLKPFDAISQNETSNEAGEEIVVEIIDANSNSTENSASRESNVNPIFTFRSDDDSQVELKNVKYYPEDRPKDAPKSTDDFFIPHVGQQISGANKPLLDRDSDTIFYISNTEVKVGESLPTTNTYDAQLKKSRLENQFFPANYEEQKKVVPQRYEEDIILSPLKNTVSDPLKLVRGPLDISYIGESVMDVEQVTVTTTIAPPITGSTPDVIIQPALLPDMVIGVPVIGELPPQIELKEIDFMPNFDANKEESSIQYGGDLIDEGGAMGVGFDMESYPLGNIASISQRSHAIPSQMVLNHRVNHLKKDELSADLVGSSETADGNDSLRRSNESVNGTVIGEKMGNATAYSVMEEPPIRDGEQGFVNVHILVMASLVTLLPLVFSVVVAFALRRLYRRYQTSPFNVMGHNSSTDPLDAEKGNSGDGDRDGVQTPVELCASSLTFAATRDSPNLEICSNSNSIARDGDGRDCVGSVASGRAPSDTDVDCIQTIAPDDVQEETFIVNCTIEARPTAATSTTIPQTQSTNTTNAAASPTSGTMQSNYSGANGSITTMTLKNNHLIVETEERNDISRDARETKMHYNNSEKDGVFVVEVSRGVDSKVMPGSPVADQADKRQFNVDAANNKDDSPQSSHEEVQIHPPPAENLSIQDEIESNHLHQIDEVDESEEVPKLTKHSNTGLSQSDLSSSSSVDSNKRYSYGNQELYTIEQQDYTTPSPAATKAPHPHVEPQPPQPENHNDDNGHSENGHCLENGNSTAPICDTMYATDTDSEANGRGGIESKPKITAALLKQDTVIVNEITNGFSHNGNEYDAETPRSSMEHLSNGHTVKAAADYIGDNENGFDSIISLPDPPSTEEMKQMNDIILMETNQLDSLPPPPPPTVAENHQQHNGNGVTSLETENGDDSHSIVSSSASPNCTPIKVTAPPTITVAMAPSTPTTATEILHTNGNCMTGHTTTSTAAVVEVSGSS